MIFIFADRFSGWKKKYVKRVPITQNTLTSSYFFRFSSQNISVVYSGRFQYTSRKLSREFAPLDRVFLNTKFGNPINIKPKWFFHIYRSDKSKCNWYVLYISFFFFSLFEWGFSFYSRTNRPLKRIKHLHELKMLIFYLFSLREYLRDSFVLILGNSNVKQTIFFAVVKTVFIL